MAYINAMVCAVPTAGKETYTKFAAEMARLFREYGAVECVDAWGMDVQAGSRPISSAPCRPGPTVCVSWITWADKAAHDAGWEKVMKDPRMAEAEMPFDGQRMIHGGFEVL
jgi:uncharacterized protein YbaA (DUF1428 family)